MCDESNKNESAKQEEAVTIMRTVSITSTQRRTRSVRKQQMLDGTSSVSKDSYKFLMAPSVADDAEMQEPDVASEKNKSEGSVKVI